ncbi:hypothetical protein HHL19_16365 [Streptomyces sp. R302]|uniref:hypothetical protein n=1 Tax=unclassified Streptomyces TaxID=2593676 RepID=UPI00145D8E91|nr:MULTISPECIES: hypothetical protein [unclassified Streptomyces]NML55345.1 hypothetical protein [Streptomyces sp. R301]NML80217.1 hypothetical protein [Streptomyces sp. R302]
MDERTQSRVPAELRRSDLAAQVRAALGVPGQAGPQRSLGETNRQVRLWSVLELDAAFQQVGGLVTATPLDAPPGRTWLKVNLTAYIPGLGPVRAFAPWEPAAERYGFELRAVRIAEGAEIAAARVAELHREAAADYAEAGRQRADTLTVWTANCGLGAVSVPTGYNYPPRPLPPTLPRTRA